MKNIGKLAILGAVIAASATSAFATSYTLSSFGGAGLAGYQPYAGAGDNNGAVQYVGFLGDASDSSTTPYGCGPAANCSTSVQSQESSQTFANLATYTSESGTTVEQNPLTPIWDAALPNSAWVGINANAGPVGATFPNNPPFGFYEFQTTFTGVAGSYGGSISVLSDDSVEAFLNGVLILPYGGLDGFHGTQTSAFGATLLTGTNTLTFVVAQEGNASASDPSGLDFTASLSSTPEPSSLLLMGTGLVGAAGMMFRRRLAA